MNYTVIAIEFARPPLHCSVDGEEEADRLMKALMQYENFSCVIVLTGTVLTKMVTCQPDGHWKFAIFE